MHPTALVGHRYAHFKRKSDTWKAYTLLANFQPVPAVLGFIGCFLVVFVFTSAIWWDSNAKFTKVAAAYAAVSGPNPSSFPHEANYSWDG